MEAEAFFCNCFYCKLGEVCPHQNNFLSYASGALKNTPIPLAESSFLFIFKL